MPTNPFTADPALFDHLFPEDLLKRLPAIASQNTADKNPLVHAHFTMGVCTWLILEASALLNEETEDWQSLQVAKQRGTWPPMEVECFALCDLGMGFPELGHLYLSEIFTTAQRSGMPDLRRVADFRVQRLREAGKLVDWTMHGEEE